MVEYVFARSQGRPFVMDNVQLRAWVCHGRAWLLDASQEWCSRTFRMPTLGMPKAVENHLAAAVQERLNGHRAPEHGMRRMQTGPERQVSCPADQMRRKFKLAAGIPYGVVHPPVECTKES